MLRLYTPPSGVQYEMIRAAIADIEERGRELKKEERGKGKGRIDKEENEE